MISVIQLLSVLFGLIMLYIIQIHRRKNIFNLYEVFIWTSLWVGFIYVAIFPQTFSGLLQTLHIARVFDLLVIIAFMIITFITIQNRASVSKLQKKLEEIVRKRSLNDTYKIPKN